MDPGEADVIGPHCHMEVPGMRMSDTDDGSVGGGHQ